uniref:Uncharacterized protein n=1 Tax=Oryza glumipatula TaxID=40148 RepID=A0A0D9YGL9_9ORYZ
MTVAEGQEAALAEEVVTCAGDGVRRRSNWWLRLAGEVGSAGSPRRRRWCRLAEGVAAGNRPTRVGLAGDVEDGRRVMAAQREVMSVEAKPGEVAARGDWPAGAPVQKRANMIKAQVARCRCRRGLVNGQCDSALAGATLNLIKGKPHVILGAGTGSPGENASGKWQHA